jgi:DNA-binding GntR family transcriptional regulator
MMSLELLDTGEHGTTPPPSQPEELRAQNAFTRVREAILRGEIPANEPISQVKLAERLGISRTPLREALRMLEREGLLTSEPNRRVRVPPLSVSDLEQIYASRIVIEALAIGLSVPHFTEQQLTRLTQLIRDMTRASEARDLDAWTAPHREFHATLRAYAGARICDLAGSLADHSERYHRVHMSEPASWSSADLEHEAIVDACRERDVTLATRRLASHLARTPLSILALAHPEHEPATVRSALRSVAPGD